MKKFTVYILAFLHLDLSKLFKIPRSSLRGCIFKIALAISIIQQICIAQEKIGFKSFTDLATEGAFVNIFKNKPFYFLPGTAPTDANKSYCLNILFNNNFDTLQTIKSNTLYNGFGSYITLVPFTNNSNKLYYWGVATNYGNSPSAKNMIFGNANQTDFTLINHKAYYSKYYHIGKYINTFITDTTLVAVHNFKWNHPSSLPYGTSIWWLNKDMDTLQQKVYFEASGNTDLTPLTVYPLPGKDILVAGFTDTLNIYNNDAFLMRLDSAGNVKYARSIGTSKHDNLLLSKIGGSFYFVGSSTISYTTNPNSEIYLAKIDITTGDVNKTFKVIHDSIGISIMGDPSIQHNKIYLPFGVSLSPTQYRKSCYFLMDTNGVINKQYIHSQVRNGYWNSYTMPIVTDSLKNVYGSIISYNSNSDPHYTKLFKLDSNLVACYPSDAPFSFTTSIANGALHSLPMNIVTAKDSIFEVTFPGAIVQGHGFNTMVDECSGYVAIKENFSENKNFKLYPNPTLNHLEIETDEEIDYIKVYNQFGSAVAFKFRSKKSIDVDYLPSGVYFIELKTDGGVSRQKFIKQ